MGNNLNDHPFIDENIKSGRHDLRIEKQNKDLIDMCNNMNELWREKNEPNERHQLRAPKIQLKWQSTRTACMRSRVQPPAPQKERKRKGKITSDHTCVVPFI